MEEGTRKNNIAKPIKDIVSQAYIIPIYQRNYNWGAKEITQLLQDIYESYISDTHQEYFLGSLVVFKRGTESIYEVIDGQQRLTTLHLILSLLWDSVGKLYALSYDSRPEVVTFFKHLRNEQYRFKAYEKELEESNLINFLNAIDTILNAKLESDISSTLSIHNLIENSKIADFIVYLLEKVILVEVIMPEDTDVASYFEIMNNRGKQLEEHEIIKAQMMSKINNGKKRHLFGKIWDACSEMNRPIQKFFTAEERLELFGENYDKVYINRVKHLKSSDKSKNKASILDILQNKNKTLKSDASVEYEDESEEEIKYTSVIDFSNFLIHVMKLVYPQVDIPLSSDKLLKIYKNIPIGVLDTLDPFEFVEKLFFYRVIFDRFIVKSTLGSENDDQFEIESNTARWILHKSVMYWKNNKRYARKYRTLNFVNSFEDTKYQERIVKLLSMLQVTYRQRKNKNYLQYILGLFDSDNASSLDISPNLFLEKLEDFVLRQFKKQDIIEYIDVEPGADLDISISYHKGTDTSHFIFNFIDYLLWVDQVWNNVDWNILTNFDFTYRNSVEHHFPQAQQHMLTIEEKHKQTILHSIGNLCLISKGANSKLNDRSADDKAKDPRYSKGILTPKRKIMYNITNNEGWNTTQIMNHYLEMIKLLDERKDILAFSR